MTEEGRTARRAGLLHLTVMAAGVMSVAPSVDGQDFLTAAAANETEVIRAAFFQAVMMAAYLGFAIVLYPLLKKHNEGLAAGFLCFRIIGGGFILIGVILLPLFLQVSREFVSGPAIGGAHLASLGGLLRTGRDLVNHVGMILASCLGSLFLYYLLFNAKLVPRWLLGWGLAGAVLAIMASLLVLFGLVDVVTAIYISLNAPIAGQELIFAIWLIVKGFEPSTPDATQR